MNDIVLVTVSGDSFKTALMRRIAELEVEAEEEQRRIDVENRKDEEYYQSIIDKAMVRYDKQVEEWEKWNALARWQKLRTPEPHHPLYFHKPQRMSWVLRISHSASQLAHLKSYIPCPNGPMQIGLSLAQELGLV